MAFYTTSLSPGDFLPLFQLMDDYCDSRRPAEQSSSTSSSAKPTAIHSKQSHAPVASASSATPYQSSRQNTTPSFTPRFDVRESDTVYILDGELPGAHQENIEIEFTNGETIVIKGRVERNYESLNNNNSAASESIQEKDDDVMSIHSDHSNYHSPTVEDDDEEDENGAVKVKVRTVPVTKTSTTTTVAKNKPSPPKPEFKYWASERSVGTFQRSFTFPARVDQDGVKATLRNGILSVTVPKRTFQQVKRIRIE